MGGLNFAHQVQTWMKDLELVCYGTLAVLGVEMAELTGRLVDAEKNPKIAGTWYENK